MAAPMGAVIAWLQLLYMCVISKLQIYSRIILDASNKRHKKHKKHKHKKDEDELSGLSDLDDSSVLSPPAQSLKLKIKIGGQTVGTKRCILLLFCEYIAIDIIRIKSASSLFCIY